MNCLEARRALQTEPRSVSRGLAAHLDLCAECRGVSDRLLALDARIRLAVQTPVPEGLAERVLLQQAVPPSIGSRPALVLAAGLAMLLVVVAAAGLYAARPRLVDAGMSAIRHVMQEPAALLLERSIDEIVLRNALGAQGVAIRGAPGRVTYRAPCTVSGGEGEHFVVRAAEGIITLILDPRVDVSEPQSVSAAHGLVAVVVRSVRGHIAVVAATREQAMAFAARLQQRPV